MVTSRLGILGADRYTDLLVDVLSRNDRFELAAICDPRAECIARLENRLPFELYDDPREMIMRSGAQILLVWSGEDHWAAVESALEREIWVCLRTVDQAPSGPAGKLLRQARKQNVGVFVWAPWLFVPSFESIGDYLADQQIGAITSRFSASDETLDWPGLENPLVALTYPSLFLTQGWLGLPERVYCRQMTCPSQESATPIRYHCGLFLAYRQALVQLAGSLNAGPDRWEFVLQGSGGAIEAALPQAHWYDGQGKLLAGSEHYTTDLVRRIGYERMLNALWQAYQERQRSTAFELGRHIGVMAVLEAAALSAKTGDPETPAKVAELNELMTLS
ncbi:MAG: hypothetical protein GXY33_20200 [Phycisphaerae bacterium]|nr:hypothetical protein [Phycisphaerae bacterium]